MIWSFVWSCSPCSFPAVIFYFSELWCFFNFASFWMTSFGNIFKASSSSIFPLFRSEIIFFVSIYSCLITFKWGEMTEILFELVSCIFAKSSYFVIILGDLKTNFGISFFVFFGDEGYFVGNSESTFSSLIEISLVSSRTELLSSPTINGWCSNS